MALELPEALSLARQMDEALSGKRIDRVHLAEKCASLILQGFMNLHQVSLTGKRIESVISQGKWIHVRLQPDTILLFALETGGKLLFHASEASLPEKFHVRLDFDDGTFLTEQIVGWGWARAVRADKLAVHRYPGVQGLSPVDETEFTLQALNKILEQHGGKNLKRVLLDQASIAGIGNGYLQDILFGARLHPKRKAAGLDSGERMALYRAIREILAEAIRLRGRDTEVDLYGNPGGYKAVLDRHMKGQPCPGCGAAIEKLNVSGSSCYVCPACQK
jgi:formamidopyrimidine-DNA glycosylase